MLSTGGLGKRGTRELGLKQESDGLWLLRVSGKTCTSSCSSKKPVVKLASMKIKQETISTCFIRLLTFRLVFAELCEEHETPQGRRYGGQDVEASQSHDGIMSRRQLQALRVIRSQNHFLFTPNDRCSLRSQSSQTDLINRRLDLPSTSLFSR
mgnify:FL=1